MSCVIRASMGVAKQPRQAMASAGFAGVKIFDNVLPSVSGSAADVRRMTAVLDPDVVACQPFRNFESMPANQRDRVARKFDALQQKGCDLLVACPNTAADSAGDLVPTASHLDQLGQRAGGRRSRVGALRPSTPQSGSPLSRAS
jgi:4-hydroxyphenylpyruvate dioxygenase